MSNFAFIELDDGDDTLTSAGIVAEMPTLAGDLYAAYLLGEDYSDDPLRDLSLNGRDLTMTGSPLGPTAAAVSLSNYFETPFSGTALFTRTGGATIIAVCRVDPGNRLSLGTTFKTNAPTSGGLGLAAYNSEEYVAYIYTGAPASTSHNGVARDGTMWEFVAATWPPSSGTAYPTIYRRRADFVNEEFTTGAVDVTTLVPGAFNFRIGADYGVLLPHSGEIAAWFAADDVLTQAELDTAYAEIKALVAIGGISI